jgi:hypothetical protein
MLNFFNVNAQEDVARNFRFGLKLSPNISWLVPFDEKKMTSNGAEMKFSYGLITEFRLNKTASFCTGIEMNYSGGTLLFTAADSVYYQTDDEFISDLPSGSFGNFLISKRKFQMRYVDIPLTIKLRTPEIGSVTYFGQFGANVSIRTKIKAEDSGELLSVRVVGVDTVIKKYEELNIPDIDITDEVNFFRLGMNVGLGLEYNLIGTTTLTTSLNFFQGFTNVLKPESEFLRDKKDKVFTQSVKNHFFMINIGLLF